MYSFLTIITGVVIFILSQYLLELILKHCIEMKKLYALISEEILSNRAKITNGNIEGTTRMNLKALGAKL
ncbi:MULTISPECIES: hypothetical protein [Francisella]|uniref:Uncharacterized protein n=1 Tax=Francisella opportunistica TaxID=2016517 RepID=A0A345JP51_9GAMM|nr:MULTISPECIES: hypothetical protein [Francisella]AXH29097.1 hypothetical protein CGC43_00075 [Francisella opportunistica]AXH30750.1 hypothetical protein CGC44_00075 [Francisella opportunistica]AXH32396.1 hypothetical protein CGC45_00075 [Francisella opportunistica]